MATTRAKPETEGRPRRLSLSQILELVLTRSSDRSLVALTRNAKGETQIEVQVRTADSGEVATIEDAERKAREVYDRLRAEYPAREGDEGVVELTRNAKGETQIEVQVKATDSGRVTSIDAAKDEATEAFKTLRGRFPLSDGTVGGGAVRG